MAFGDCSLAGCKKCTPVTGDSSAPSLVVDGRRIFFCTQEHLWQYEDQQKKTKQIQLELALPGLA